MVDSRISSYSFHENRESLENYLERFNLYNDMHELKPERKQKL